MLKITVPFTVFEMGTFNPETATYENVSRTAVLKVAGTPAPPNTIRRYVRHVPLLVDEEKLASILDMDTIIKGVCNNE